MPGSQVIVGLGNPGPEQVASRHNVGHAVVDRLGARLGARFRLQGPAHVAEVPCRERRDLVAERTLGCNPRAGAA